MKFPIVRPIRQAIRESIIASADAGMLWVPNLLGAQYGQLTVPWVPDGLGWSGAAVYYRESSADMIVFSTSTGPNGYFVLRSAGLQAGMAITEFGGGDMDINSEAPINVINQMSYDSDTELFTANSSSASVDRNTFVVSFSKIGTYHDNTLFMIGQIHSIELNDPLDAGNNLNMNFAILSVEMPTDTNIYDQFGAVVGTWNNLDVTNPYVPLLTS